MGFLAVYTWKIVPSWLLAVYEHGMGTGAESAGRGRGSPKLPLTLETKVMRCSHPKGAVQ